MPHPASRGPGRPPAAKAADTRKRIVLAARDVFSERGYDAATFQEIALRADLTRPAINHYFANKRVLYREVVEQTTDLVVRASISRARRKTSLGDQVSTFLNAVAEGDVENRSATKFLITAVLESQRHPELNDGEEDALNQTRAFLLRATTEAIGRGELPAGVDAEPLTELLLAVLCGVGFYSGFVGSAHEMAAIVGELGRLLGDSL